MPLEGPCRIRRAHLAGAGVHRFVSGFADLGRQNLPLSGEHRCSTRRRRALGAARYGTIPDCSGTLVFQDELRNLHNPVAYRVQHQPNGLTERLTMGASGTPSIEGNA